MLARGERGWLVGIGARLASTQAAYQQHEGPAEAHYCRIIISLNIVIIVSFETGLIKNGNLSATPAHSYEICNLSNLTDREV